MRSAPLVGVSQVIAFVLRGAVLAPLASVIVGAGALFIDGTLALDALPSAAAVWWTGDPPPCDGAREWDIWYLQAFVAAFAIRSLDQRRSMRRASEMEEHFRSPPTRADTLS